MFDVDEVKKIVDKINALEDERENYNLQIRQNADMNTKYFALRDGLAREEQRLARELLDALKIKRPPDTYVQDL